MRYDRYYSVTVPVRMSRASRRLL